MKDKIIDNFRNRFFMSGSGLNLKIKAKKINKGKNNFTMTALTE